MSRLSQGFALLLKLIKGFFKVFFGEMNWTPPEWFAFGAGKATSVYSKNPKVYKRGFLGVILIAGLSYGGWIWYDSRPKPEVCSVEVSRIYPTPPDVDRAYALNLRFGCSAANMSMLDKPLTSDLVSLKPEMRGVWRWTSEKVLTFEPDIPANQNDWAIGEKYKVKLSKRVLADHIRLEEYDFEVESPHFTLSSSDSEFNIDPVFENIKRGVFNLTFNYPVDAESLKKAVSLEFERSDREMTPSTKAKVGFSVAFSEDKLRAIVTSENLPVPRLRGSLRLYVDKSVRAQRSASYIEDKKSFDLEVPGLIGFFRIDSAHLSTVQNEKFEPERVLIVKTNLAVASEDVEKKLKVWLMPKKHPDTPNEKQLYNWSSASEVTPPTRAKLEAVKITTIPTENPTSKMHSFKVEGPMYRYFLAEIGKGLTAHGGYELADSFESVLRIDPFPKEISISGEGSLLSLSGDKKINVISRGIETLNIEVSRLIPDQMNHAIKQISSYDLKNVTIWAGARESFSEVFRTEAAVGTKDSNKTQFYALDLEKYLSQKAQNRRGLFYLNLTDKEQSTRFEKLILVTDLGIILKRTASGLNDVFVQSVATGLPVSGASVEVMGNNGISVASATTDAQGHVQLPNLQTFKQEKEPIALVVQKDGDMSFIPLQGNSERRLGYSRYDVGGDYETSGSDALTAMVFSDRGLYRPGDNIHFGSIVRSKNPKKSFSGVPVLWSFSDPNGVEVQKGKFTMSSGGLQSLTLGTSEISPTGRYSLSLYVETKQNLKEVIGSIGVKVEEFQPDKLKLSSKLSKEVVQGWIKPESLKLHSTLLNLFGTPAQNRMMKAHLVVSPIQPAFRGLSEYSFAYINQKDDVSLDVALPEKRSGADGTTEWELDLSKFSGGFYRLAATIDGFESESGRSVTSVTTTLLSTLPYLIGIKSTALSNYIDMNQKQSLSLKAVNSELKPVSVSDAKLELVESKSVSVLTEQYGGVFKYQSVQKDVVLETKTLSVSESGAQIEIPTDRAGDFAFVLKTADGREVNRYGFSVTGEVNMASRMDRNAEVQLLLAKNDFEPQDTIDMQIRAPYAGAGLITIERDQVYTHKWFKASTNMTRQSITIPQGLEGNAYVTVTFLRAIDSKEIYMSPLSYAAAPFSISLKNYRTTINLKSPELVKPGETLTVKYSANRKTDLVLYGVDEGILQVAKYSLPKPIDFFFRKKALQVSTLQILDLLLPEFSILKNLSAAGGDEGFAALGKNLNPFKRKSQPPVVFWSEVLTADTQTKDFTYKVPDYYNGNIKIMAVASSTVGMGEAETSTLIRGDIILTPSAPLFATPGDVFDLGVGVANQINGSGVGGEIKLEIEPTPQFEVVGEKSVIVKVAEGQEGAGQFLVKGTSQLGEGKLIVKASSGKTVVRLGTSVSLRPATSYMSFSQSGISTSLPVSLKTERRMFDAFQIKEMTVGTSPLVFAKGLLNYLDVYPYLCTEQLLSRAFPALHSKVKGFSYESKKAAQIFEDAIKQLRTRQTSSGGFALYPGSQTDSDFATLYALHFLTEGASLGWTVPNDLLNRGIAFAKTLQTRRSRESAYAIYLLARNNVTPQLDAGGELKDLLESKDQSVRVAFLAAALKILNMDELAQKGFGRLELNSEKTIDYLNYYDPLIRDAHVLYLAAKHFPQRLNSLMKSDAVKTIYASIQNGQFNTLSSAQMILAFTALEKNAEALQALKSVSLIEDIESGEKTASFGGEATQTVRLQSGTRGVKLTGSAQVPLFYMATENGFDREASKAEIKKGLELSRSYLDAKGNKVSEVKQGETIDVKLRLRSSDGKFHPHIAVVELFPAGFELVFDSNSLTAESGEGNSSGVGHSEEGGVNEPQGEEGYEEGEGGEGEGASFWPEWLFSRAWAQATSIRSLFLLSIDKREDRLVVHTEAAEEIAELAYQLKAVNPGTFAVPPAYAEGMYDRSLLFRGVTETIKVVK